MKLATAAVSPLALLVAIVASVAGCGHSAPPRTANDMRHMEAQQSVHLHTTGDNSVQYVDPSERPALVVRPEEEGVDAAIYGPDPVTTNADVIPTRRVEITSPDDDEEN